MHVKTGDEVLIITGKDKGKRGKIKEVRPREGRVIVEGLNIVKRHMRPRGPGKPSGIIEMEAPLDASNVMLICPNCGRASRTGRRFLEETDHKGRPRKVRYCKACDSAVDE
ncbi:MAG: 50S ribosomal protein L24 [Chloroflexota bacterium]|nr:MAG: 50S ribosomal protein L24 [Chloroflexota bacterium]